jgi:integrase/recombinase XerD
VADLSRIRVTGPLEPYVSGFVAELTERGYTPVSAADQLRLMAHVSRWLSSKGSGPDDLSLARVEEFVAARRAAGYVNYVTPRVLTALFGHLRDLGGRAARRRAGALGGGGVARQLSRVVVLRARAGGRHGAQLRRHGPPIPGGACGCGR